MNYRAIIMAALILAGAAQPLQAQYRYKHDITVKQYDECEYRPKWNGKRSWRNALASSMCESRKRRQREEEIEAQRAHDLKIARIIAGQNQPLPQAQNKKPQESVISGLYRLAYESDQACVKGNQMQCDKAKIIRDMIAEEKNK